MYAIALPALSAQRSTSHAAGSAPPPIRAFALVPSVYCVSVLSVAVHDAPVNSISSPVASTIGRKRRAPMSTSSPTPTSEHAPGGAGSVAPVAGVILRRIVISPSDQPMPNAPSPAPAEYCSVCGGVMPFGPAGTVRSNFSVAVPVFRSTLKSPPSPLTDPPPEGRFRISSAVPLVLATVRLLVGIQPRGLNA